MTTAEIEIAEVPELPRIKGRSCQCFTAPRDPLFELAPGPEDVDREPRMFTVPEYFEGHVTLDYLEILETRGSDSAFRWAMITALGKDGWLAMRSPGMDEETFGVIGRAVLDKIRGANKRDPKARD